MVGAEHLSAKAQPGLTLAGSAEYSSKVGIKCAVSAAPEIRALPDSCQSARGARLRRAPWPDAMSSHGAGRKRHHLPPILSPSVLCYEGDAAWGGGALSLPAPPGWDVGPGLELTCKQGEALSPGRALARGGHCDVSGPAGSCGVKDVNFCLCTGPRGPLLPPAAARESPFLPGACFRDGSTAMGSATGGGSWPSPCPGRGQLLSPRGPWWGRAEVFHARRAPEAHLKVTNVTCRDSSSSPSASTARRLGARCLQLQELFDHTCAPVEPSGPAPVSVHVSQIPPTLGRF